jgi:hypothetical protein
LLAQAMMPLLLWEQRQLLAAQFLLTVSVWATGLPMWSVL